MVSEETTVFRSTFGRGLTIFAGIVSAIALVSGLVGDARQMLPFIAPVALVMLWVWAAYWQPAVIVNPAGVEIRNITRTIELPWPTIQRVETKYALTLFTAFGSYAAWAAPAPSQVKTARSAHVSQRAEAIVGLPTSTVSGGTITPGDLATSASGQAAAIIRHRWEELRDAGLLDNPQVEREKPRITWHWATLAGLLGLLTVSVVGIALR